MGGLRLGGFWEARMLVWCISIVSFLVFAAPGSTLPADAPVSNENQLRSVFLVLALSFSLYPLVQAVFVVGTKGALGFQSILALAGPAFCALLESLLIFQILFSVNTFHATIVSVLAFLSLPLLSTAFAALFQDPALDAANPSSLAPRLSAAVAGGFALLFAMWYAKHNEHHLLKFLPLETSTNNNNNNNINFPSHDSLAASGSMTGAAHMTMNQSNVFSATQLGLMLALVVYMKQLALRRAHVLPQSRSSSLAADRHTVVVGVFLCCCLFILGALALSLTLASQMPASQISSSYFCKAANPSASTTGMNMMANTGGSVSDTVVAAAAADGSKLALVPLPPGSPSLSSNIDPSLLHDSASADASEDDVTDKSEPSALALQRCVFVALALSAYHLCALHAVFGASGPAIFIHAQTLFWAMALIVSIFFHQAFSQTFEIAKSTTLALLVALVSALANTRALTILSRSSSFFDSDYASKDVLSTADTGVNVTPPGSPSQLRGRLGLLIAVILLVTCFGAVARVPRCPTLHPAPVVSRFLDPRGHPHPQSHSHPQSQPQSQPSSQVPISTPSPTPAAGESESASSVSSSSTTSASTAIANHNEITANNNNKDNADLSNNPVAVLSHDTAASQILTSLPQYMQRLARREKVLNKMTHLRSQLADIYSQYIQPNRPVALFGVPRHWNLGDSFIWLGQKAILDSLGLNVVYTCFDAECSKDFDNLAKVLGNGTIVIHGGGNYGDLYRFNNALVTRLLSKFPDNRVVQLPQSIFYRKTQLALMDFRNHFKHPQFFLLLRDQPSFDFVHRIFQENLTSLADVAPYNTYADRVVRCPDSAIAIGPVLPNCEPDLDVVYLSRRDGEKVYNSQQMQLYFKRANLTFTMMDWMADWKKVFPMPLFQPVPNTRAEYPLFRLHAANNMLCRGRVIVSDRLHASILSLFMNRPFVGVDNVYHKMERVVDMLFRDPSFGATLTSEEMNFFIVNRMSAVAPKVKELLHQHYDSPTPSF